MEKIGATQVIPLSDGPQPFGSCSMLLLKPNKGGSDENNADRKENKGVLGEVGDDHESNPGKEGHPMSLPFAIHGISHAYGTIDDPKNQSSCEFIHDTLPQEF